MAVITMGGLTGGGGRILGQLVAHKLGADYVDRLMLTNAARHLGATAEALYQREKRPPTRGERFSRILQRILERSAMTGAGGDPYFGPSAVAFLTQEYEELSQPIITRGHELEDEKYIETMRSVMQEVATSENVVIVGRGGSIMFRDHPRVLRVGVVAEYEERVSRILKREHLTRDEAVKVVKERDDARAYYFKRFFDIADPEDPESYHMTINSSAINMGFATDLVVCASEALITGRLGISMATAV